MTMPTWLSFRFVFTLNDGQSFTEKLKKSNSFDRQFLPSTTNYLSLTYFFGTAFTFKDRMSLYMFRIRQSLPSTTDCFYLSFYIVLPLDQLSFTFPEGYNKTSFTSREVFDIFSFFIFTFHGDKYFLILSFSRNFYILTLFGFYINITLDMDTEQP